MLEEILYFSSKLGVFPANFMKSTKVLMAHYGHTARAPPGVPHTRASLEPGTSGFSTLRFNHYAPPMRKTLKFRNTLLANPQYDSFQMAGWLRNYLKFLSPLWINQDHTWIHALQVQDENAHQNRDSFISSRESQFFYWSIGFMIKMLLFKFASFTISKRALEMTFKPHSWVMLYNTDWCYTCMTPWYIARGGLQLEYRYSECYIN